MHKNEQYWYALYTRPRWEKKVAGLLEQKGIECYCPLNKVTRQWTDRKKVVLEPIFKTYVFVKIADEKKWDLKKVNGIVNFVYWLGKPAQIREEEINTIKKFLNEFSNIQIEQMEIKPNSRVRIKQGILMNYEGILVEVNGTRAKVRIESMGIQLSAQFEKKNIEVISTLNSLHD